MTNLMVCVSFKKSRGPPKYNRALVCCLVQCLVYLLCFELFVVMELPHIGQHCCDPFCKRLGKYNIHPAMLYCLVLLLVRRPDCAQNLLSVRAGLIHNSIISPAAAIFRLAQMVPPIEYD